MCSVSVCLRVHRSACASTCVHVITHIHLHQLTPAHALCRCTHCVYIRVYVRRPTGTQACVCVPMAQHRLWKEGHKAAAGTCALTAETAATTAMVESSLPKSTSLFLWALPPCSANPAVCTLALAGVYFQEADLTAGPACCMGSHFALGPWDQAPAGASTARLGDEQRQNLGPSPPWPPYPVQMPAHGVPPPHKPRPRAGACCPT